MDSEDYNEIIVKPAQRLADALEATPSTPAARAAALSDIARKLVLQINEITPTQWDKHDDKDQAIVLAALLATEQQTRKLALEEAAKVAREYSAFTGFGYCDELASDYDHTKAHDYGRGCHQTSRGIADAIDRLAREGVSTNENE